MVKALEWKDGSLHVLDQLKLPHDVEFINCKTLEDISNVIVNMNVRGAPAIGVTAAYGIALHAADSKIKTSKELTEYVFFASEKLRKTRPTAVNLFWAIDRMIKLTETFDLQRDVKELQQKLLSEAKLMAEEDVLVNRRIGQWGQSLLADQDVVLTHCNAGALATVDYGTALGVVRSAYENGKKVFVYADETRPYLQGARLTAFELMESGIDVTLITDGMSGHLMKKGKIDAVIVGADRIAANGDVANKIGTYMISVVAKENNVPFYVAAPLSTFDLSIMSGDSIEIEERSEREVTHINGMRIAPVGVKVANPAFDVTPNKYVSGIITEKGIIYPPYKLNISAALKD